MGTLGAPAFVGDLNALGAPACVDNLGTPDPLGSVGKVRRLKPLKERWSCRDSSVSISSGRGGDGRPDLIRGSAKLSSLAGRRAVRRKAYFLRAFSTSGSFVFGFSCFLVVCLRMLACIPDSPCTLDLFEELALLNKKSSTGVALSAV